jgi:hypothetical protein
MQYENPGHASHLMRETKVFERKGKTEMKTESLMIPFCTSLIYKADTKCIGLVRDSIQAWMFESMQVCKYASMQVCNYAILQYDEYANIWISIQFNKK